MRICPFPVKAAPWTARTQRKRCCNSSHKDAELRPPPPEGSCSGRFKPEMPPRPPSYEQQTQTAEDADDVTHEWSCQRVTLFATLATPLHLAWFFAWLVRSVGSPLGRRLVFFAALLACPLFSTCFLPCGIFHMRPSSFCHL